jgi:hypothetical protein
MIRNRPGGGTPGTFGKFQQVAPPGRRSGELAGRPGEWDKTDHGWDKIREETLKKPAFLNISQTVGGIRAGMGGIRPGMGGIRSVRKPSKTRRFKNISQTVDGIRPGMGGIRPGMGGIRPAMRGIRSGRKPSKTGRFRTFPKHGWDKTGRCVG